MILIGLGHYSRTGKDTFADAFVQAYGPRAKKMSFAWKLKLICYDLYAWAGMKPPRWYDTPEGAKDRDIVLPAIGKTPVQIWVDMGTKGVRDQVYDRTWIDYLRYSDHDCDVMLVPDVRFPNEVEVPDITIKVVRPGYGPRKTLPDRLLLPYRDWDYVIGASGNIEDIRVIAKVMSQRLKSGAKLPVQTEQEKFAALGVEKIEPWEDDYKWLPGGFSVVSGRLCNHLAA